MGMNTWLSTTTDMLRSTSIPLAEVATSAKVELRWLYKFKDGSFRDPGVTKVQRIYDFLNKKQGATNLESPNCKEATSAGRSGDTVTPTNMEGRAATESSAQKPIEH